MFTAPISLGTEVSKGSAICPAICPSVRLSVLVAAVSGLRGAVGVRSRSVSRKRVFGHMGQGQVELLCERKF